MADTQQQQVQTPQAPAQPGTATAQPPAPDQQETQKKRTLKRKAAKKNLPVVRSKRKEAIARAYVRSGTGVIKVNGVNISAIESTAARNIMLEAITISEEAKGLARKVNIKVNVRGGGTMSQMQAVRGAIAKGLVEYSGSASLKSELLSYNRALLVDDPRRVEPKKFKGPKARARFQTSYR